MQGEGRTFLKKGSPLPLHPHPSPKNFWGRDMGNTLIDSITMCFSWNFAVVPFCYLCKRKSYFAYPYLFALRDDKIMSS